MHIPLAYADAVIGAAGASISYIRRHSGATVTIQESRGAPGEMAVEIIGTAAQVQTAQQLIQVTSLPCMSEILSANSESAQQLMLCCTISFNENMLYLLMPPCC